MNRWNAIPKDIKGMRVYTIIEIDNNEKEKLEEFVNSLTSEEILKLKLILFERGF